MRAAEIRAIKTCAICGAPAFYIVPPEGRCEKHKQTKSRATILERLRSEAHSNLRAEVEHRYDQRKFKRGSRNKRTRKGVAAMYGIKDRWHKDHQ